MLRPCTGEQGKVEVWWFLPKVSIWQMIISTLYMAQTILCLTSIVGCRLLDQVPLLRGLSRCYSMPHASWAVDMHWKQLGAYDVHAPDPAAQPPVLARL